MSAGVITCKVYRGISRVPAGQWDQIAARSSLVYSSVYWQILESSEVGGFDDFHYLMIYLDAKPVCIAACYVSTLDVGSYAGRFLQGAIAAVRRVFPGFLIARMLECGTPINIHSPPYLNLCTDRQQEILQFIGQHLESLAKMKSAHFVGIKDIHVLSDGSGATDMIPQAWSRIDGAPGCCIDIRWTDIDEYLQSMKSYYRSKLNRHLEKNAERNVSSELLTDFAELSVPLARQWREVHGRLGGACRESIGGDFYAKISDRLGHRSMVLLFYADKELLGHALLLHDGQVLKWLYTGRQEKVNDSLYLFVMYKVIEVGITLGVEKIDCGPTTYDIKTDLGARIEPLSYALKCNFFAPCKIADGLLRRVVKVHTPKPKEVFKR